MLDPATLETLSGLLLLSGSGVLGLAAFGAIRAEGAQARVRFAYAAAPGLWSVGLAIVLHALA
ncbi:MAG: hypothetical protein HY925_01155 [Elusimicrobia bacterium]|nr:hypothetical protein [Elusimicrobiota bacterium]